MYTFKPNAVIPKLINPKNENEVDLNGYSAQPKTRYSLVGALLYFVPEFYLQVWMHFFIYAYGKGVDRFKVPSKITPQ